MTTAVSFEGIRYVRSSLYNTTALTPLRETHHKGGVFGKILGVVAAIVVPFVAPMIAGALFGSSMLAGTVLSGLGASGTLMGAAGSALVGAGLGAGTAALTGGDPLTGALVGGLGGGLAGYMAPAATGTSQVASGGTTPTLSSVAGQNLPPSASLDLANTLSAPTVTTVATPAGTGTLSQTLSDATGNTVSPQTISDLGGKLATGAIGAATEAVPSMLASQEAAAAAEAEAKVAAQQNAIFQQQLSIAEDLKKSALAVDPQYLGQRATAGVFKNLAAQQREMAGAEAIRGAESQAAYDAAELRRGQIYGTEAAITAGDNARLAGLSTQNQMLRAASAAYPTPPTRYASYLDRAAGNAAEGWGNIAGAFAYPFLPEYMRSFYNSQKNPNAVG